MHAAIIENLSAYLDGQLAEPKRAELEAHLAGCESCRGELESLRRTVALLRRVPPVAAPRSFALDRAALASSRAATDEAAAPPAPGPDRSAAPPCPALRLVHSRRFYRLQQATGALAALFVCVFAMSLVAGPTAVLLPREQASTLAAPASTAPAATRTAGLAAGAAPAAAPVAPATSAPAAARAAAPQVASQASSAAPQPASSQSGSAAAPPQAPQPSAQNAAPAAAPKPAAAAAPTSAPSAAPASGSSPAVAQSAADTASRGSSVANAAKAVAAPTPAPPPGPPVLGYLAGALGVGLVAVAGAWGYVWLRERPSGGR